MAKAWVEMSDESKPPAVVKTAITNLKAALGAMRSELRFWEQETKTEQDMRKEMNKLAEI